MEIIKYPGRDSWQGLLKRPAMDVSTLFGTVREVMDSVRTRGDEAVKDYEKRFDHVALEDLMVAEREIEEAESLVDNALKEAIRQAKANIEAFHAAQKFEGKRVTTTPGVVCWQKAVAIEKVGLYIPGGTAPLFSTVLMLAVPARIAGCREIVMVSPPSRGGEIDGVILEGSSTLKYVTAAKQLVSLKEVAIDMPAGPSEVEVIADDTSNPNFIAADFLSQAEHGVDSQALLVTDSEGIVDPVVEAIERQMGVLPRKEITQKALEHSRIIVLKDKEEVIEFTNLYAPEHLIIQTADYAAIAERVENAGSVFMGPYTPESAGDYASGTNHTLPTNGYAKAYSGVNLDSFIKKITFQEITSEGIKSLGDTIRVMAQNESLEAHRNAVTVRLNTL